MIRPFLIAIGLCSIALFSCGDYPIFTEMATNRMKVVLKGTYESNDPAPWNTTGFDIADSVDDNPSVVPPDPTLFLLDIAEMRLHGGGDADKFGFYRQTYTFSISNLDDFFNGTGVLFDCDDPYSDYMYSNLYIYIRKMIFNNAADFRLDYSTGTWIPQDDPEVIFQEREVSGFDINKVQYTTYWDTLRVEGDNSIYIFPLAVEIPGGLVFDRRDPETVLEVRFVVKNFIKRFELDYYSSGYYHVTHFWGLSDWLRTVLEDEAVMGGNILAVARAYVPGKTATIQGAVATGSSIIGFEYDGVSNIADLLTSYNLPTTTRPDESGVCYQPKPPTLLDANNIEAVLDYHISYEKYKEGLNEFIDDCLDVGSTYADAWDQYYSRVKAFKIPPLATRASGTSYTLKNVPVGKHYVLCRTAAPDPDKSELPNNFIAGQCKTVSISENAANTIITENIP